MSLHGRVDDDSTLSCSGCSKVMCKCPWSSSESFSSLDVFVMTTNVNIVSSEMYVTAIHKCSDAEWKRPLRSLLNILIIRQNVFYCTPRILNIGVQVSLCLINYAWVSMKCRFMNGGSKKVVYNQKLTLQLLGIIDHTSSEITVKLSSVIFHQCRTLLRQAQFNILFQRYQLTNL